MRVSNNKKGQARLRASAQAEPYHSLFSRINNKGTAFRRIDAVLKYALEATLYDRQNAQQELIFYHPAASG